MMTSFVLRRSQCALRAVRARVVERVSDRAPQFGAAAAAALLLVGGGGGAAAACLSVDEWLAEPLVASAETFVAPYETAAEYVRADVALLKRGGLAGNAIYDTLGARTHALQAYRIYAKTDGSEVVSVVTFGEGCEGHPGVVHGGVTALLFDNTLGWANATAKLAETGQLGELANSKQSFGLTANLSVNYRSPCLRGTSASLTCRLDRVEGRKRFLVGEMRDITTGRLIADATALFVMPRPLPRWKQLLATLPFLGK